MDAWSPHCAFKFESITKSAWESFSDVRGCIGFPICRVVRTLRRVLAHAAALLLLIPAMLPAYKQLANWASEVGFETITALALGRLKVLRGGR